jgi:hypothetical protein
MLENFPDSSEFDTWYASVSLGEDAARPLRWKSVLELAAVLDASDIEVLVRLALRTQAPPEGHKEPDLVKSLAKIVEAFRANDSTFDPIKHPREFQVLAGCILALAFKNDAFAALAVITCNVAGARTTDLPMEIVKLAEQAVATLGLTRRKRPMAEEMQIEAPAITFEIDEASMQAGKWEAWSEAFVGLRTSAEEAVQDLAQRQNVALAAINKHASIADEELQMLWWLIGGASIDLGIPFDKVDTSSQPLIFAKELADVTVSAPGPISINSLLSRAGLKGRSKLLIVAAVNSVDLDWAKAVVTDVHVSPATTPIHYALDKRVETNSTEAWTAAWTAVSGLPADLGVSPIKLAELFYRERLLLTADF